jgi:uncharacterized protein with HEPN domain
VRDDRERLRDMLEAIERIEKYTADGRATFEQNELVQNWVVHHLQIIGEAARALSTELRAQQAQVPWSQIIGMRNILVHDYFAMDIAPVWQVVEGDLPKLKQQVAAMLRAQDAPPPTPPVD